MRWRALMGCRIAVARLLVGRTLGTVLVAQRRMRFGPTGRERGRGRTAGMTGKARKSQRRRKRHSDNYFHLGSPQLNDVGTITSLTGPSFGFES
jgi:hypothetical protein